MQCLHYLLQYFLYISLHLVFKIKQLLILRQIVIPSDGRIDDSFVIQDNLVCTLERLENIAELETNWNGYGAEPFSVALVEEVKDIILKAVRRYKSFTLKQAGWKLDETQGKIRIGKRGKA